MARISQKEENGAVHALSIQPMKHHDRWTIKRSTRSMLWGSALAMLISCALFAGATHAWFSDRCSAQIKLQSATFNVGVEISPVNGTSVTSTENGIYVYNLSHGTYTVKLTRVSEGTVGYCEITVGDVVYYSPNLTEAGFSFDLTITLPEGAEPVSVTFTPVWSDVTKVEGVDPIDSGKTISYSAGSGLFAMGAEPGETVPSEP